MAGLPPWQGVYLPEEASYLNQRAVLAYFLVELIRWPDAVPLALKSAQEVLTQSLPREIRTYNSW